jgi:RecA-family ATPase
LLPPLEFMKADDLANIPAREWYYAKQHQRGAVSGTMAPGGLGKSSLALVEAVSMATNRKLLHALPLRQLRVWYHNGEETWDELRRRIGAVCKFYSISPAELEGWLCVTNPQKFPLRVAEGFERLEVKKPLIAHMRSEIERNDFDVLILDPLITMHGVHENNTVLMRGVMDIFRDLAAEQDCSIEVVGHTRKPQAGSEEQGLSTHDARGASSITDALRVVRVLDGMSEREAEAAEVEDRAQYVSVTSPKRNYSAAQTSPDWVKIESVTLFNGDDVGVVTPWEWPAKDASATAEANKRAEDVFVEVAVRLIGMGRRLSDRKGINYAPKLIIAADAAARRAKIKKAALEGAMARLIEQNKIELVDTGSGNRVTHEIQIV